jgi:Zn finger protein HypA/HybF involved in hydrogenase expression
MSWQHRLPEGLSDVEITSDGFRASLSLPADDDGFFGRECPACEQLFKIGIDEWEALPDDALITCPYCGEQPEDVHDFMTGDQRERVDAALNAMAEQYAHGAVSDIFKRSFGSAPRRTGGGMFSFELTFHEGSPPPIRVLPEYVEREVRRTIKCGDCSTTYAVYGASAFCPVCGPRAAFATVVEAIGAARVALSLEDLLPEDAGIPGELRLPKAIADDNGVDVGWTARVEDASQCRTHTEDRQYLRRHLRDRETPRLSAADQIHGTTGEHAHVLERPAHGLEIAIVGG